MEAMAFFGAFAVVNSYRRQLHLAHIGVWNISTVKESHHLLERIMPEMMHS